MHITTVQYNVPIVTPLYGIFNNGFLEECDKEGNVEVNGAATAYCSKGRL